ncbi:MAG: hypothetical protein HRT89_01960, partial [Lentisphaeria bacterium]|nr:hypothetical protein [Lentisphaeria bacterium]
NEYNSWVSTEPSNTQENILRAKAFEKKMLHLQEKMERLKDSHKGLLDGSK